VKETKLCTREWIDVAMRRHLVILKMNFVIKLAMRRYVLSLLVIRLITFKKKLGTLKIVSTKKIVQLRIM